MNSTTRTVAASLAAAALAVGLAACAGTATTSAADSSAAAAAGSVVSAGGTVSANDASTTELVAALTAGGVNNAQRWAGEIEEYRPYDAADPTLRKLQDELAKYNPGADTTAKIIAVLRP